MKRSKSALMSLVLLVFISLYFITGCKKDNNSKPEYQSAADNTEADISFNDVLTVTDQVIKNEGTEKSGKGKWYCATITREKINDYYRITVDFGATNTTCFNNIARRGKIMLTYKGNYFIQGFTDTISFDNFYLNNRHIEGKHIVTNIGNLTWAVSVKDMKVTRPDGYFHTWNSERQRQLLQDTSSAWDTFVYKVTGSVSGVNINGLSYTADIKDPLIKALGCWWIASGSIEFNAEGKPTVTINYGDGTCDNKATVTVNGKTYDIKI